ARRCSIARQFVLGKAAILVLVHRAEMSRQGRMGCCFNFADLSVAVSVEQGKMAVHFLIPSFRLSGRSNKQCGRDRPQVIHSFRHGVTASSPHRAAGATTATTSL